MQKFTLEGGRWIDALCENDKELSAPGFKKPEDTRYGIKTYFSFFLPKFLGLNF